ncbi:uncharacterized protein LOC114535045 [Dendronephthya gigantea]|uniref:uncharacterized protein LOC114535045 n=1 Tax=Dendronephthya gigantea TaxID=151771 RepID=UPI00106B77CF|nr:uncharacterized protein LOC114535045 [Dendronephthya gigantea]XP_028412220.1 uncharacterized protein LOC114535045 [Dendronephthya gigantea]
MASIDLQEKANFTRLSRLLVDKGTDALRNTFDTIHPPVSLPGVLAANKTTLQRIKPRIINNSQWDLLFPPSGNPPDSKTFDVTLLTVLFRNICGFPSTGWGVMPPDTDRSTQANIARIKWLRNDVYAHVTTTKIDGPTFESLWTKISQALVDLGIPQDDVDDLKLCPLAPEEEVFVKALEDWKLQEDVCITLLGGIESSVNHLTQITEELRKSTLEQRNNAVDVLQRPIISDEDLLRNLAKNNFRAEIKSKVKFFQAETRDWLLKQVDEWFHKSDSDSRILLVVAGPGFGKSVFAAKICENFGKNGKLAACHFCDLSESNLRDPKMMLQSLASQMCENVPDFKEKLLDQLKRPHHVQSLKDAFRVYLQNPLDELDFDESCLVVIDGLHEGAADDKTEIVDLIADYFPVLPEYVKLLVTSRPGIAETKLRGVQKIVADSDSQNDLDVFQADLNSEVHTKLDAKDENRNLRNDFVFVNIDSSKEGASEATNHVVISTGNGRSSVHDFFYSYQEPRGPPTARKYTNKSQPKNDTSCQDGCCPICGLFFTNVSKLQAHVNECLESDSTESVGKNICPVCQGSFSDVDTLQVHVMECLDDSNTKTQTQQRKAKKTKSSKKKVCKKCHRTFPDSDALQDHVMKCPKDFEAKKERKQTKTETTDSVGKFKCKRCDATFQDWETHLEHVTGGDLDPSDMIWKCPDGSNTKKQEKQSKSKTRFICKHCQAYFPDWQTHLNHSIQCAVQTKMKKKQRKFKTADSVGLFICPDCQASFQDYQIYQDHVVDCKIDNDDTYDSDSDDTDDSDDIMRDSP